MDSEFDNYSSIVLNFLFGKSIQSKITALTKDETALEIIL